MAAQAEACVQLQRALEDLEADRDAKQRAGASSAAALLVTHCAHCCKVGHSRCCIRGSVSL